MLTHRVRPLERDQYFAKTGHSKLHPNKDHTLVGARKSPPCCIHLYGSAVVIQTIWGTEWICRDPSEEAGHPQPSLTALFPPLLGQAAFLRCPGDLRWRREHHSPRLRYYSICYLHFPPTTTPQRSKGNIKQTLTDRWAGSHYFGISA